MNPETLAELKRFAESTGHKGFIESVERYCAKNSPGKEPDDEAIIQAESQRYLRARDGEPKRKIVQLVQLEKHRACVDSDGRAWEYRVGDNGVAWYPLPDLPQGEI